MTSWTHILSRLGALMALRTPRRRRTDPEDYQRRSAYPASRADDELADQMVRELGPRHGINVEQRWPL